MTSTLFKDASHEISVIVQGPFDKSATSTVLKKIRELLPNSEIILSTWEGSQITSECDYDKLLFNKDPNGTIDPFSGFLNNLNRQIVSTSEGLKVSSKKYTLKIRSDLILDSLNFLNFWDKYPFRNEAYKLFNERIITSSFFCKKFIGLKNKMPVPYHLGDWIFFGLTDDLKLLWDIPLASEPAFTFHFFQKEKKSIKFDGFKASHRLAPEQYIFISALQKKYPIQFNTYLDYSLSSIELSQRYIINNFTIINPEDWSFHSAKPIYKKWTKNIKSLPRELYEGIYRKDIFEKEYQNNFSEANKR